MSRESFGGLGHSTVASQPYPLDHITADKRSCQRPFGRSVAKSFIRKSLGEIRYGQLKKKV